MIQDKLIGMIDTFRSDFENLTIHEKQHEQMINSLKNHARFF